VIGRIRRWREQRGTLPDALRAELEAEGVVALEERLPMDVVYRGYAVPGQRPRSGHVSGRAALALTDRRLVVHGTSDTRLDVPRGADWLRADAATPDRLKLAYDAEAAEPNRSGEVEIELETPRAADIHARLQAWIQTPPS
jgi:hypothetical protein